MTPTSIISFPVPVDISHADWRRLICTSALRARYGTVESAAREWGISRQTLYAVIRGAMRSGRVETQLSEIVGQPRSVLFPASERVA